MSYTRGVRVPPVRGSLEAIGLAAAFHLLSACATPEDLPDGLFLEADAGAGGAISFGPGSSVPVPASGGAPSAGGAIGAGGASWPGAGGEPTSSTGSGAGGACATPPFCPLPSAGGAPAAVGGSGAGGVNPAAPCKDLNLLCFDVFDMWIFNPELCRTCNAGKGCQTCAIPFAQ